MKINYQNSSLFQVAGFSGQFPQTDLPHIVISGKSNVGKSSLINAICNNKNLARTSSSPGKTRQVIFYLIDQLFYLVDLPGYGYAKASYAEQEKFSDLTNQYLNSESNINLIVQLIDIRHKPSKDDLKMLEWISFSGIPYIVVLTKADKLKRSKLKPQIETIRRSLSLELREDFNPIVTSAINKQGISELKSAFEQVI
ncbi:MAG: YihA family ribosome biogenesis GTP-binding protein [Clostridiaceae bacterium]|nr:ribosome biogenesis GTP-binding protein YihA/YsxC [Bacillota bacterium]NLN51445.1 YihA family ribosome biogenesis GTP-binding protein [Clostridiaceae bacterium]